MNEDDLMGEPKQIQSISHPIGQYTHAVGKHGVAHIKPYHENGQMAPVVWFVLKDTQGNTLSRVDSAGWDVYYGGETNDEGRPF